MGAPGERRDDWEDRLLSALPEVEAAIRFVARRNHLSRAEEEEFGGEVRLAFVEGDYRILRRFQGHSSLRTYLAVVVQRLFLDHRQRVWGKWRPSAEAQRRGPIACQLEALLFRDRLTLDEAVESLRARYGVTHTRDALVDLASALPSRAPRRQVGDDALATVADGTNPEADLAARTLVARTQAALDRCFETFTPQDSLVLRLRFEGDVSVADIARSLGLDQRSLYRRIEKLLDRLRKALEGSGLAWPAVLTMIEARQCHLRLPVPRREMGVVEPSNAVETP